TRAPSTATRLPYTPLFRSQRQPAHGIRKTDAPPGRGREGRLQETRHRLRPPFHRPRPPRRPAPPVEETSPQTHPMKEGENPLELDRKSTRLNSSHVKISYA